LPDQRTEKLAEGVYAAMRMQSGDERSEYVDAPTVQKIRALSKVPNSLMYTTVWTEGWKKIAVRRLAKLAMVAEPRMVAAEAGMLRAEGFTFNETGDIVDVPRGTQEPARAEKPKGMNGLKARMDAGREREPDERPDLELTPETPTFLALAAPSIHPPGSIEWWLTQIDAADDRTRLELIREAAIDQGVDKSEDAGIFREHYAGRARDLRSSQR
jgi:hypothetical protein